MSTNEELVTEVSSGVHVLNDQLEYHWLTGCTVTAVTTVLGYWDRNGYGNLIEGDSTFYSPDVMNVMASAEYYRDYGDPLDSNGAPIPDASEYGEAHENNCVADFLHTSRSSEGLSYGWTPYGMEGVGVHGFATFRGYDDFVTQNKAWGQFDLSAIAEEIDAGRPVILSVDARGDGYNDHDVVVYGYNSDSNQLLIQDGWAETDEPRWIDFKPAQEGHNFGIVSMTTVHPGDTTYSDGAANFLHFENDGSGSAALFQDIQNDDGTFDAEKVTDDSGMNLKGVVGMATADGHTFYQLYDDGSGSAALYRAEAYGDGRFKWSRLSDNSKLGLSTLDFATADGMTFYRLYDDGSGTAALYKSERLEDGTFSDTLLNVDSGMSRNTIGLSTIDGETFYQYVNDGFGNATLNKATLNEDGSFSFTLVTNDSSVSNDTIANAAWQSTPLSDALFVTNSSNGVDGENIGGDDADIINGTAGDDTIRDIAGNSRIYGGDGYDTLVLTGSSWEYSLEFDGEHDIVIIGPNGERIAIEDVEQIQLEGDGETYSIQDLLDYAQSMGLTNPASEGEMADTGSATDGDDVFSPKEDNSFINGLEGNDTLVLDGAVDDYNLAFDGHSDVIIISPDGTKTAISNVENVQVEGEVFSIETVIEYANEIDAETIDYDASIYGSSGADNNI